MLTRLLSTLVSRTPRRPGHRPRHPLRLERLEDRLVPSASSADVTTYKGNTANNGLYANETALTPQNVSSGTFGKIAGDAVDGQIYAQPLYVGGVSVNGRTLNLVIVATENDSVYAFNADTGARVWHVSFANSSEGVTPVPAQNLNEPDLAPEVGITATPVYDPSTGVLFVEDRTLSQSANGSPVYAHQLHALDVATGQEADGGPVTIGSTTINPDGTASNDTAVSVPGSGTDAQNGRVSFNAMTQNDRAALVLDTNVPGNPDGVVYLGFASLGDLGPYHGWLVGYDARTLKLYSVFNTTPDADHGALWSSGAGPALDAQGNLYLAVGDGPFNAYSSTAAAGASALGSGDRGLGYGNLGNSLAVEFNPDDPPGHSSTGLLYDGAYPTYAPTAPDQFVSLDGSNVDFHAGATAPTVHTYQATLNYDGTNLVETLVDQTTGATFTHTYAGVNLPATVGGGKAYVGFTAGSSGDPTEQDVLSWTYQTDGSTVIDHAAGFASNGDLTANGSAQFAASSSSSSATAVQLTQGGMDDLDQAGSVFANQAVDVSNFTTTFTFQMMTSQAPAGEGITFTIQNAPGNQPQPNYGDAVLKLSPDAGTNRVLDFFAPGNAQSIANNDRDLGSGGVLPLSFPGTAVPHELVIAGKGGTLYLLNADHLGGFSANGPDNAVQELTLSSFKDGTWGTPVVYNNTLYIQSKGGALTAYRFVLDPATNTMKLDPTPVGQGTQAVQFPNMNPVVSSAGSANGIVWGIQSDNYQSGGPETLHAYDPNNLGQELFNSSANSANQADGSAIKFAVPTVAGGKVYIGTGSALDVYGLQSGSTGGGGTNGGSSGGTDRGQQGPPPALIEAAISLFLDGYELAFDLLHVMPTASVQADIAFNLPYAGGFGAFFELAGVQAALMTTGNSQAGMGGSQPM